MIPPADTPRKPGWPAWVRVQCRCCVVARAPSNAGIASALAAQAMFPVTNRGEMRGQPGVDPQNELAPVILAENPGIRAGSQAWTEAYMRHIDGFSGDIPEGWAMMRAVGELVRRGDFVLKSGRRSTCPHWTTGCRRRCRSRPAR